MLLSDYLWVLNFTWMPVRGAFIQFGCFEPKDQNIYILTTCELESSGRSYITEFISISSHSACAQDFAWLRPNRLFMQIFYQWIGQRTKQNNWNALSAFSTVSVFQRTHIIFMGCKRPTLKTFDMYMKCLASFEKCSNRCAMRDVWSVKGHRCKYCDFWNRKRLIEATFGCVENYHFSIRPSIQMAEKSQNLLFSLCFSLLFNGGKNTMKHL